MTDPILDAMLDRLALQLFLAEYPGRARKCEPTFGPGRRAEIEPTGRDE